MKAALSTLLFLAVGGCSIDLVDGAYACSLGVCPSGWYCHQDSRCHRSPEEDSGVDGERDADPDATIDATTDGDSSLDADAGVDASIDAGTGAALYEPCTVWSDCGELMCAKGPDSTASLGQCSRTCTIDTDCPTVGAATGTCIAGNCLRACTETTSCPGAFGCFVDPTTSKRACFEVDSTAWKGDTACGTLQAACVNPSQCVNGGLLGLDGACVVPCTATTDDCPWNADCVAMPSGTSGPRFGCLARCATSTDCNGASCTNYGSTGKRCAPAGWGN